MKKKKTLIILSSCLIVLIVLALIFSNLDLMQAKIKAKEGEIMQFNMEEVTFFSVSYNEGSVKTSYTLKKSGDSWIYNGDDSFPVNNEKVTELLSYIQNYKTNFTITHPDALGTYGLANPKCEIKLTAGNEDYDIKFGGFSTIDEARYISTGDGNVYLSTTDVMENFKVFVYDLIASDSFPNMYLITDFDISGSNNLHIYYDADSNYCYSTKYSYYMQRGNTMQPLHTDNASNLISSLTSMNLQACISHDAKNDMKEYNLDDPAFAVTITYLETEKSTEKKEITVYFAEKDDANCYAMFKGSSLIYYIDPDVYKLFSTANFDTVRATELVKADLSEIEKFEISFEGTKHTITVKKATTGDEEYVGYVDDNTKELKSLTQLMTRLTTISVSEFSSSYPEKAEQITIKFYFKNEKYSTRTVSLFSDTGSTSIMEIGGIPLGKVNRTHVVNLMNTCADLVF